MSRAYYNEIETGVRLLADDVPGHLALLRIGGNAIVPVLAALSDVLPEWRAA